MTVIVSWTGIIDHLCLTSSRLGSSHVANEKLEYRFVSDVLTMTNDTVCAYTGFFRDLQIRFVFVFNTSELQMSR